MADDVEQSVHQIAAGESPGTRLNRARKAKKLTTRQVAKKLHMDSWMLDAIERDEFSALGAPVFAKGHLRKYAVELDVDPDELMVAYYQMAGTRETPPLIAESLLRMEAAQGPGFGWLLPAAIVVATVAAVTIGAMWYVRSGAVPRPASAAAISQPLPSPQEPGGADRSLALSLPAAVSDEPQREDAATLPLDDVPEPLVAVVEPPQDERVDEEPVARVAALDPPVSAQPAESATPAPAAQPSDSVTLTLRFREQSWVEVYDRDRNKLLYGMGESGTVQYLSGPAPLQVFLGRFRDVDVEVNGTAFSIPPAARRTNTARFRVEDPITR